jgi:hypothetical protein
MPVTIRKGPSKARGRLVPIRVYVGREAAGTRFPGQEFTACVTTGLIKKKSQAICVPGKSPHAAIGAVLEKAGRIIRKRRSAFARYKRRKQRR